ncbi:hypothetical protein [Aristaeella lactis]|uniref:Uncharacterized protein n=1 Tax=Aristaeella lactis TaxID=3046383 RepID=A0AC61PID6_9FIRM|nr:hypothetical protein [Aristaeella lactis]QUA53776.1 hypothetical protein JYE50_03870 [Aristaeella lactis]SMC39369.1 hypothetical protein SAMN06297397_0571 [Aristaeella lactis]
MRYTPVAEQIGITEARYKELRNFCRQYDDWDREAKTLLGIRAIKMDGLPHGSGISDPVARAAERRERLLAKMSIVEGCAKASDNGAWYEALIEHVCRDVTWKVIKETKPELLPTSDANTFYKRRREFFDMLNKVTDI